MWQGFLFEENYIFCGRKWGDVVICREKVGAMVCSWVNIIITLTTKAE